MAAESALLFVFSHKWSISYKECISQKTFTYFSSWHGPKQRIVSFLIRIFFFYYLYPSLLGLAICSLSLWVLGNKVSTDSQVPPPVLTSQGLQVWWSMASLLCLTDNYSRYFKLVSALSITLNIASWPQASQWEQIKLPVRLQLPGLQAANHSPKRDHLGCCLALSWDAESKTRNPHANLCSKEFHHNFSFHYSTNKF
jgi:hypothetical protein